ncbi:50S ribosomal protein L23 [Leptolyngbya sp. 15MV]|nr:50S ribosomal protein L23 [Leptolyngbya sp. 15MV]
MLAVDVIKRPLLTEKSTYSMNELRQYAFVVDKRATKRDIRAAVESLYKVKVTGVNTMNRKGRARATRFGLVQEPTTKKAIVTLAEGQTIELF